jgi:mycofactocin precursor
MVQIADHPAEVASVPEPRTTTGLEADADEAQPSSDEQLVLEDLLIEDVSIDGMCGVY